MTYNLHIKKQLNHTYSKYICENYSILPFKYNISILSYIDRLKNHSFIALHYLQ